MTKPLAAIWLVALVAVFAIFTYSMHQDRPDPFAIPVPSAGIPLERTETPQGEVMHVVVDNLPTAVPAPTRGIWQTPTAAVPNCPGKDGALCQIPAPVVTVPTTPIAPCSTETLATFMPGEICRWEDMIPTVSQQEEPFQ